MTKIDCVFPGALENENDLISSLKENPNIGKVFFYGRQKEITEGGSYIAKSLIARDDILTIAEKLQSDYTFILTNESAFEISNNSIERFISVAEDTGAGIVYSDFRDETDEGLKAHPVIDYQEGSLRDDFDFGPLLLLRTEAFKKATRELEDCRYAALYQLRLEISRNYEIFHLPEYLYSSVKIDLRKSGKKIFDYVDPKNREVQIEMEKALTSYLKKINAWLSPDSVKAIEFDQESFKVEASVIIPVRNREKTIADAIESVMIQNTDFEFNLIIVNNKSTDSTASIIESYKSRYPSLIHIVTERPDLGIGGCWNLAIQDERCGKFAVQLDSDDLYKDENTLSKIVQQFYKDKSAMVIGSYQMTNFDLEEIPPGLIDHREWTDENGRNNALRINGLGAPRAFYTPVLRELLIPNSSYGEDYAIGIAISRNYKIGRIYEPVYLCRRWDDNSDATLSVQEMNKHNLYKDRLRTIELKARMNMLKD